MSKISTYLENALINHTFRNTAYTQPTVYLGLHTGDPGDTGSNELSGGAYQRVAVPNWDAASARASANTNAIQFGTLTAAVGDISYFSLWDALSGGNLLWYSSVMASSLTTAVGIVPRFDAGAIAVSVGGDISTYLANKWLDHVLGTTAYTTPGTSIYVSLHDGDPGLTGDNEISGNDYARVQVSSWDAPSDGDTENSSTITFATPSPSDWGTITHAGIWDASTSGNFLKGGDLDQSFATDTSTAPDFSAGNLDVVVQ